MSPHGLFGLATTEVFPAAILGEKHRGGIRAWASAGGPAVEPNPAEVSTKRETIAKMLG